MSNIKKVFSLGLVVLALAFVIGASQAEAATITSTATGNWADGATWVGGVAPVAADDVVIATNTVVTVAASATAASITINSPVATNGITIATGQTLTVTGAITYVANATANHQTILMEGTGNLTAGSIVVPAPTSTGNSVVTCSGSGTFAVGTIALTGGAAVAGRSSIDMAACTLNATGLVTLTGGGVGIAELTATDGGILNLDAGVTFAGTLAQAKIETSTAGGTAARIDFTGTLTGAGTINLAATTLTRMIGTVALDAIITGWKAVQVVSGTTTLGAAQTVVGLQVDSGATLAAGANLITNTGTSTGTSGFTINGTLSGTGGVTLSGIGATIDGTGTISNTGTLTLTGAKTIASTAVLSLPGTVALSAATTVTNNGSITTTAVGGITGANGTTSIWTQGTTGVLSFGGATTSLLSTGVLTASATGNTVNYSLAGAQTVKVPATSYYNLTLSGGSAAVKTFGAAIDVLNTLSVAASTSADLTGATTTKYLRFNGGLKHAGTWGFTGSGATHIITDYITAGTGTIDASSGSVAAGGGSSSTSTSTPNTTTTTTTDTTDDTTPPATTAGGEIPGCGTRTTGFSTSVAGLSCVGNANPSLTVIPGCGNRTTGFSTSVAGQSCAGNSVGAASARTYNLGATTLKNGSRGEAAKELQRFLNDKLALGLVVDGIIGPKTIAVIKTWQSANGLVADGLIGPKTKAKINAQ